ncbi:MAG: cysteine desulfurase [Ignavibacteria bacterium]|nr:cysteine desulfurase [Ignavibacteria bacterium]
MIKFPIYLDNHSTTPVDPKVVEFMLPFFTEVFGNPSSKSHEFGWKADAAVENSRKLVARLINAESRNIIFTSGATESVNLAIKGAAEMYSSRGNHIITTTIEHEAVLDSCKSLEKKGFDVTYLDVDNFGIVNPNDIKNSVTERTILVSVMYANNEIGTIQPLSEIGKICKSKHILFHTDATQAVGKIPVDVLSDRIDLLSFSSHKIYGPKGVGALYMKSRIPKIRIAPQIDGGLQERGLRAGTLNVPGIAGFGKACEIAKSELIAETNRINSLKNMLYNGIITGLNGVKLNGHPKRRIANNLNLSFEGINSDSLILAMKEVAVSTGSACSSETGETSHVLKAINIDEDLKHSAIRFGIGRFNNEEEIIYTINKVIEKVNFLRQISLKSEKGEYAEV